MKITVITPTWNQADFIRDTIESVLNQNHKDIEYIIIDNESDDGTKEIVEEYQSKDSRIIYIRESDNGQANAINKGLDRASGDIVCWLNSDDYYYDMDVLFNVNRAFEKHNSLDIIVGDGWYSDKDGNLTEYNSSDRDGRKWVINRWYYVMQPSIFWRNNSERLDERYHYVFDWKFFAVMFSKYKKVYVHQPLSVYRMYDDNKTGQDNSRRKLEIYELQKEIGGSLLNAIWCKKAYELYAKAEEDNKPELKKKADTISKILFHITNRRICSF